MQHLQPSFPNEILYHHHHPSPSPSPSPTLAPQQQQQQLSLSSSSSSCFSIEAEEPAATRIQRLISEHPVIIFSRSSCCMCHVMKKLLATIGVHPTVIELDDDQELAALPPPDHHFHEYGLSAPVASPAPSVFIGGKRVGGLESLVALHVSGHLVPKLVEVGALWDSSSSTSNTTTTLLPPPPP